MSDSASAAPSSATPTSSVSAGETDWLARYQPWRHIAEPAFWILLYVVQAALNSLVVIVDVARSGLPHAPWQPTLWEWSSNMMLLALVPMVVAMDRRFPLRLGMLSAHFKWHLAATVVYSLIHVFGMVAIRKLVYAANGGHYDFGNWPLELIYEYMKDARSYFAVVLMLACYDLLMTRLNGEAALLAAPDAGKPEGSIERPERFLVKKLGREFLLPAAEVEYLQAMGNYVNLHVRGKDYPLRSTMTEIETRFDPARFVRVHRSYIVNLDTIAEIEPLDSGDARARLKTGVTVPISRRYRDNLREAAR